jgi:hypothetical protein
VVGRKRRSARYGGEVSLVGVSVSVLVTASPSRTRPRAPFSTAILRCQPPARAKGLSSFRCAGRAASGQSRSSRPPADPILPSVVTAVPRPGAPGAWRPAPGAAAARGARRPGAAVRRTRRPRCIDRSRCRARPIARRRCAATSQPARCPRTAATARRTRTARVARTAVAPRARTTSPATSAPMTNASPMPIVPPVDRATVVRAPSPPPTCAARAIAGSTRIVDRAVTVRPHAPAAPTQGSRLRRRVTSVGRPRTPASRTTIAGSRT